jgi:hypothetical protein
MAYTNLSNLYLSGKLSYINLDIKLIVNLIYNKFLKEYKLYPIFIIILVLVAFYKILVKYYKLIFFITQVNR